VEDDGLMFLPDTIRVERIRDDEAYEGVRVRVEARLGDVRIPLQIDAGLGDAIVPAYAGTDFIVARNGRIASVYLSLFRRATLKLDF
jgi:hypothetical protein